MKLPRAYLRTEKKGARLFHQKHNKTHPILISCRIKSSSVKEREPYIRVSPYRKKLCFFARDCRNARSAGISAGWPLFASRILTRPLPSATLTRIILILRVRDVDFSPKMQTSRRTKCGVSPLQRYKLKASAQEYFRVINFSAEKRVATRKYLHIARSDVYRITDLSRQYISHRRRNNRNKIKSKLMPDKTANESSPRCYAHSRDTYSQSGFAYARVQSIFIPARRICAAYTSYKIDTNNGE